MLLRSHQGAGLPCREAAGTAESPAGLERITIVRLLQPADAVFHIVVFRWRSRQRLLARVLMHRVQRAQAIVDRKEALHDQLIFLLVRVSKWTLAAKLVSFHVARWRERTLVSHAWHLFVVECGEVETSEGVCTDGVAISAHEYFRSVRADVVEVFSLIEDENFLRRHIGVLEDLSVWVASGPLNIFALTLLF